MRTSYGSLKRAGIHVAGSPVLRTASRAVRRGELRGLAPLISQMASVLRDTKGQGIAAPQLGEPVRIFALSRSSSSSSSEEDAQDHRWPLMVVNPQIIRQSRKACADWESCLSVPEYAALVTRPEKVDVEYLNLEGQTVRGVLSGDNARAFQHELDHLDGVLYTARCIASTITHLSELRSERTRMQIEADARRDDEGLALAGRLVQGGR